MLREARIAVISKITRKAEAVPFVRRIGRYGCVGFTVSIFYSTAVILCVQVLVIAPTAASLLAFTLALPLGYLMHSRLTFADCSSTAMRPVRFALSNVTSFVVSIGGMYWITVVHHDSYLVSVGWNYVLIPAMNFLLYLVWVFRPSPCSARITS